MNRWIGAGGRIVGMNGSIFINYRRDDEPNFAMLLYTRLEQKFPADRLFMDISSIAPGDDFVRILRDSVEKCDIVLAIIGKNWLGARDHAGNRRLDDPNDFVRIELEQALDLRKRVIPILVGSANMPNGEDLPDGLRPLATRNAVRFLPDRFRSDAENLERALDQLLTTPPRTSNPLPSGPETAEPAKSARANPDASDFKARAAGDEHAGRSIEAAARATVATAPAGNSHIADSGPRSIQIDGRDDVRHLIPTGWMIRGQSGDAATRLPRANWQRATLLAAISTVVYLLLGSTELLVAQGPVRIPLGSGDYSYNPAPYFGAILSISAGAYLFTRFGIASSIKLFFICIFSTIFSTLFNFLISSYFIGIASSIFEMTIVIFVIWAVIAFALLVGISFMVPNINRPRTVFGLTLGAALVQALAYAAKLDLVMHSLIGTLGVGYTIGMIVLAAGCGWFFGATPSQSPGLSKAGS